jgi:hypothetical protein
MELQQLIEKWEQEMADRLEWIENEKDLVKRYIHISAHTAISDMLTDVKQLNLPPVSNSLPDFRDVIEARIKYFNSKYHTYEGLDLQNALNTIRRLVPPILFQIGQ